MFWIKQRARVVGTFLLYMYCDAGWPAGQAGAVFAPVSMVWQQPDGTPVIYLQPIYLPPAFSAPQSYRSFAAAFHHWWCFFDAVSSSRQRSARVWHVARIFLVSTLIDQVHMVLFCSAVVCMLYM